MKKETFYEIAPKPPTKAQKTMTWLVYAALIVAALIVALLLYWALSKRDVLEIHNAPFPVRTIREHPTAAGVVILKVDFCKKVDTEGRARLSFVSPSREIFLPTTPERGPAQCLDTEVPVLIPNDIRPGVYHIHFRITYQVNPLKEVVEEFDSKPFEVVQ